MELYISVPEHQTGSSPEDLEPWIAPQLIALDKIANAEKLSFNTEGGFASGLS